MNKAPLARRSVVSTACAAFAVFALAGCLLPGGDGDGDSGGKGDLTAWGRYELNGNVLSTTGKSSWYTCDEVLETPVLEIQDFDSEDTVSIQGNSMLFWAWTEAVLDDDSEDTLAVIEYATRHVRLGGGSGIRGTWRYADNRTHRVLSGTLPADVAEGMRNDSLFWVKFLTYRQDLTEYTADSVFYRSNYLFADLFLAFWYGRMLGPDDPPTMADSAYKNITVTKVDQHTVRLHGKTTGEIVTEWRGNLNEYRLTSSNPERDTIEYMPSKHACTGPIGGFWFSDFIMENSRYPVDTTGEVTDTLTAALGKRGGVGTLAVHEFLRRVSRIRGLR